MNADLRVLIRRVNPTSRGAIERAAALCVARAHYAVEVVHVLINLLDGDTDCSLIVRHFEVDRYRLSNDLRRELDRLRSGHPGTPSLSPDLVRLLVDAWVICSLEFDEAEIRSGFFLLAVARDPTAREISGELRRIDPEALRSDFGRIVATSAESKAVWMGRAGKPQQGGPRVFICYRREDTASSADALQDRLIAAIEGVQVFRDTDAVKPGMRFTENIKATLGACDVVLVLIGKKWLTAGAGGVRRIDAEQDWVRVEIATALESNKHVVPCLVDGASMPPPGDLPDDIANLASRNAVRLSRASLRRDSESLVDLIRSFRRDDNQPARID